jgi:hypothetical protein
MIKRLKFDCDLVQNNLFYMTGGSTVILYVYGVMDEITLVPTTGNV